MTDALPPFVLAERDALLKEIEAAFDGVSRQGGTSWGEAQVADSYGSLDVIERVRGEDRDLKWQDLLAVPDEFPRLTCGAWPFLDAIGFRYYLPAAMTLSLLRCEDVATSYALSVPELTARDWDDDRWTLLNLRQRRCVKRFLQYMSVVAPYVDLTWDYDGWRQPLERYWGAIPDAETP